MWSLSEKFFSLGSRNFLVTDNMLVVRLHAFMLLGSFALALFMSRSIGDMANLEKVHEIFEKHRLTIFFFAQTYCRDGQNRK